MIATHRDCGSAECEHIASHKHNDFCNAPCRWSSECRCVPENKLESRELLEGILKMHFPGEVIPEIADSIESIYKGGTDERN